MEDQTPETHFDRLFVRNMVESALRIGLIFGLLAFSYDIIRPFMVPLVWGGIIAIGGAGHRTLAGSSGAGPGNGVSTWVSLRFTPRGAKIRGRTAARDIHSLCFFQDPGINNEQTSKFR